MPQQLDVFVQTWARQPTHSLAPTTAQFSYFMQWDMHCKLDATIAAFHAPQLASFCALPRCILCAFTDPPCRYLEPLEQVAALLRMEPGLQPAEVHVHVTQRSLRVRRSVAYQGAQCHDYSVPVCS